MSQKDYIIIKGARLHNLKNISLNIPKQKLVVITGVSGSGKSTLAFNTIYAEAQRRYIESLSSYARQFLKAHSKPEFDEIKGLAPAIAIEAKTSINNPRSTVGTTTEIYHFLTLLYERIGKTISPISGKEVKKYTFDNFKEYVVSMGENKKLIIAVPISHERLAYYEKEGYSRIIQNNKIINIKELKDYTKNIKLIIDRIVVSTEPDALFRLRESFNKAMDIGKDEIGVYNQHGLYLNEFNNKMQLDGIKFELPNKNLFNFNNPYGACSNCNGHGDLIDIDEEKVIPNQKLSILDNAIHPWKNGKMEKWKN